LPVALPEGSANSLAGNAIGAPTSISASWHYVDVQEIDRMTGFWIGVVIVFLGIIGASVLIGKTVGKAKGAPRDRHSQITALKVSGALKHRKSNQD